MIKKITNIFPLVLILLGQLLVLALLNINFYLGNVEGDSFGSVSGTVSIVTSLIIFCLTIAVFILVKQMFEKAHQEAEFQMQATNFQNIEELVKTLRAQRHDFINHLQVVHGLIKIGAFDEVKNYIEEVYREITETNKIIHTGNLAVSGLLQTKASIAEAKQIRMNFSGEISLANLPIKSWEITRILGNLINNAMEAVENLPLQERIVNVSISEDGTNYLFQVNNLGPTIPPKTMENLFAAGFSTKGEEGRGMGLYIVKNLVEKNGGRVWVSSDAVRGTTFAFTIPKERKNG